jgi:hypothetical protein
VCHAEWGLHGVSEPGTSFYKVVCKLQLDDNVCCMMTCPTMQCHDTITNPDQIML